MWRNIIMWAVEKAHAGLLEIVMTFEKDHPA